MNLSPPPSLVWPDVLINFRFLAEEFKSFCKPTFLQSWQIPPSKFYCSPTWKVKSYFCCQVIHSKVFAEKEKETHNKIFNSVQSKSIFSPFMHNNAKTSSPSIPQVWVFCGLVGAPSQRVIQLSTWRWNLRRNFKLFTAGQEKGDSKIQPSREIQNTEKFWVKK